jgi:hypothetical protein
MRPAHLATILEREFAAAADGLHTPVMLWGPPGVGKSDLVRGVARRVEVGLIDLRLSQLEPTDLRGIPFRDGGRVEWSVPSTLPDALRHGPRGILFLDEINAAAPTVTAAAYQLILDRRLGDYAVPAGWAIFAAGNRQGDRGVTYAMPAPLANRFTHYELEPHLDDWVAWAHARGIDSRVIAFLRFRPELLFDFDPARHPIAFPSPRTWEYAHRALEKYGDHAGLLAGALEACVGRAVGAELKAFIDHMTRLPDIDAITRGEDQPVPESVDLQYGVAAALVRRAARAAEAAPGDEVLAAILRYARAFPQREMGVMLVSDLQRSIARPLIGVPGFSDWAASLDELVLGGRETDRAA